MTYGEVCAEAQVAELAASTRHSVAYVARRHAVRPRPPLEIAGLVTLPGRPRGTTGTLARRWWTTPFRTPELYGVCLHHALVYGGQLRKGGVDGHAGGQLLVVDGEHLVPDAFHVRSGRPSAPRDLVKKETDGTWKLLDDEKPVEREGLYYLIGAVYGHFGHFLLEGLSRLWLLSRLARTDPWFVVYEPELQPWQRSFLEAAGVPLERVLHVRTPTRFERLIVPARAYELHKASTPQQDLVWQRIGDFFDGGQRGRRVYLSRSRFASTRTTGESLSLDEVFASRGFEIVHPQELDVATQVATARGSAILAGAAGSAMYLAAFQAPKQRSLVLTHRSFAFRDDQLIAHYRRARQAWYISDTVSADHDSPRRASWTIDHDHLAARLDRWLEQGE
ncbi:MAG: glycosyltransferase family 61 protein [Solirubrobacteraceae bacterium MAG38_C4-C5]|nr:glycosyltransferase family 61 protein [Candidatus Siliceabacter maunaloa]